MTLALAPALGLAVAGCGRRAAQTVTRSDATRAKADPEARLAVEPALTAFTLDLYHQVAVADAGNIVCSPLSVAKALGMTVQGAAGTTATEMLSVLHAQDAAALAAGLNTVDLQLASRAGTFTDPAAVGEIALAIANSLWGQAGLTWEPAFLDVLARDFGTGMLSTDFAAEPEASRVLINDWVADRTNDRIEDLVPTGVIDQGTRLVLVNAVYFAAPWSEPFDPARTTSGPFTRLDGSVIDVALMQASVPATFAQGAGWSAVDLAYADGRLAMAVIVPDPGRFTEIENSVDSAWLTSLLGALAGTDRQGRVSLSLPRWTTRSSLDLSQSLKALGMPTAFSGADFSRMTVDADLAIDAVQHQGFIAVDEAGTEAAAATAVVMAEVSAPADDHVLRVDRPFIYVIHDNTDPATATPLFIGRVSDPTG